MEQPKRGPAAVLLSAAAAATGGMFGSSSTPGSFDWRALVAPSSALGRTQLEAYIYATMHMQFGIAAKAPAAKAAAARRRSTFDDTYRQELLAAPFDVSQLGLKRAANRDNIVVKKKLETIIQVTAPCICAPSPRQRLHARADRVADGRRWSATRTC